MKWAGWRIALLYGALLGVGNVARSAEDAPVKAADAVAERIVADNNQFAWELYGKLNRQPGNLFCSPYSISTALAMTYAGARGETAKQMAQAMHFGANDDAFHAAFGRVSRNFNAAGKDRKYQLTVANAVWAQRGEKFRADYQRLVTDKYDAVVDQLDFKANAEGSRRTINAWVEKRRMTRSRICCHPTA